jgi:hypothetical protein
MRTKSTMAYAARWGTGLFAVNALHNFYILADGVQVVDNLGLDKRGRAPGPIDAKATGFDISDFNTEWPHLLRKLSPMPSRANFEPL